MVVHANYGSRRRAYSILLTIASFVAIGAAFACGDDGAFGWSYIVSEPEPAKDRPIVTSRNGYVSSDECRSCHPAKYESWESSFHRTMTQEVSPATMIADFDVGPLEFYGSKFVLERRGDEYWVETDGETIDGVPEPDRVWRQLVLATGSHNFQAFWYSAGKGRNLDFLAICWRLDESRWMPVHASFLIPPDSELPMRGRWNNSCHSCHTVGGEPRLRRGESDTRVAEFGIGCEACHGPGEEHVLANRDPMRRYRQHAEEGGDDTIVDPQDLTGHLSSQVCGQCHAFTGSKTDALAKEWRKEGYPYRPGDNLTDTRAFVFEGESYYWDDGMVRLAGREFSALLRAPCFINASVEEAMSCFSCHQMHQTEDDPRDMEEWRVDMLKVGMRGNLGCVQCHTEYASAEALTAHTHHPIGNAAGDADAADGGDYGSRCYDCHMPHTSWGLLGSVRSHEVSSPSIQETVKVGRPNACNLCHLDKSMSWTGRWLKTWWGRGRPPLDEDERNIAASVLWTLSGDAAERAIAAWHMGWAPAQSASGTDWMVPYLAQLLEDPYEAVRFTAVRSLRSIASAGSIEGFGFEMDFMASEAERVAAHEELMARWRAEARSMLAPVLLDQQGKLQTEIFSRLLQNRDDTPITLSE